MIKAEVIKASEAIPTGKKIVTMRVTFPRFILAELNTHRDFSRNSSSSRAIPFKKMLSSVWNNPFIPISWQKDHKGMQGSEYFTNKTTIWLLKNLWLTARTLAIVLAWTMHKVGLTKQLCNRILEPFMWHTALITATEWENFFALRCPQYRVGGKGDEKSSTSLYRSKKDAIKDYPASFDEPNINWLFWNKGQAEIHIMALAEAMWDAYNEAEFEKLEAGQWHIPFSDKVDYLELGIQTSQYYIDNPTEVVSVTKWLLKIATAMCARVSYTVFGEVRKIANYLKDAELHDNLADSGHWSPFEHCAKASNKLRRSGNFVGWMQYRKQFLNENIK